MMPAEMTITETAAQWRHQERGVAMISIMLLLIIVSALGIGALTITGMENRMAGFASTMESSSAAAEACVATGVKVIQQVLDVANGGSIPTALLSNQTPPGPVPATNQAQLELEIMGDPTAAPDVPIGPPFPPGVSAAVPNLSQTIGAYSVVGDIDRLYVKPRAGSGQQFGAAYDGTAVGAGSGGMDIYYRIDCAATNLATGMSSRIAAVYSCLFNEGCTRRL
jgi:Tfp pilus assembly protein PilX